MNLWKDVEPDIAAEVVDRPSSPLLLRPDPGKHADVMDPSEKMDLFLSNWNPGLYDEVPGWVVHPEGRRTNRQTVHFPRVSASRTADFETEAEVVPDGSASSEVLRVVAEGCLSFRWSPQSAVLQVLRFVKRQKETIIATFSIDIL